jgi:UDP-N-acetylmuramyl pentapeptide phosphotransferase/UDP-N-acetylglucosamine-1-phosphate transferase
MTNVIALDLVVVIAAAAVTAGLIVLLYPLLQRYALARPNARSSHRVPTPQGGGIAVLAAVIVVVAATAWLAPQSFADPLRLAVVCAASAALALVGAIDDIRPIDPAPRLLLQALAVAAVIAALPADLRVVPALPWWIERAAMALAVLWLVNLVNFMDGIDWITVAEVVPVTAALALFAYSGALPHDAALAALALCGGMLGFAPFNRPVARLFLGDVGSLPIGLLLGWLLILLAERHLAAALLLPLYYLADATVTLLRRLARGERITQAHRSHFYQKAVHGSLSVRQVVGRIFAVNVVLALLAFASLGAGAGVQALALAAGAALVAVLLLSFSRAGAMPR